MSMVSANGSEVVLGNDAAGATRSSARADWETVARLVAYGEDAMASASVAARVGFGDTSHLAHVFQRITGRPPSAYRRGYSAV